MKLFYIIDHNALGSAIMVKKEMGSHNYKHCLQAKHINVVIFVL